jgi:hypothetical protein
MSDISIRKVKVLQGRAKAEAEKQGLNSEDLVIVKTSVKSGSLPEYHIEKIEGDPVSYLLKRVERENKEKSKNYAKLCARLHEQVIGLTLKDKELKRKLQKWFDKYRVEWIKCPQHLTCAHCENAHYCEFQNVVKEFEELLKEEEAK